MSYNGAHAQRLNLESKICFIRFSRPCRCHSTNSTSHHLSSTFPISFVCFHFRHLLDRSKHLPFNYEPLHKIFFSIRTRKMNDFMNVDFANGRPVNNQSRVGAACFKCGRPGHKAAKCRNPEGQSNDGGNQHPRGNQNANGSQNGNSRQNQQRSQSQSHTQMASAKHCDFHPGKNTHTTEECSKNSKNAKAQPDSNGSFSPRNTNDINGFAREGYVFRDRMPTVATELYCAVCNRRGHNVFQCPNPEAASSLFLSTQTCRRCCLRGHLGDECQNPIQQLCSVCHKAGHKTAECKNEIERAFRASAVESERRFKWDWNTRVITADHGQLELAQLEDELWTLRVQGLEMDPEELQARRMQIAEAQTIYWPNQKQPLHYACLNDGLAKSQSQLPAPRYAPTSSFHPRTARKIWTPTSTPTPQTSNLPTINHAAISHFTPSEQELVANALYAHHEASLSSGSRQLRAHIDLSARSYKKENYNPSILRLESSILEKRILSDDTYMSLKFRIAQGYQFWRDPKLMEALATKRKPRCHFCNRDGILLDGRMRGVDFANVDVTTVKDHTDWGLFAMFDCKCCNDGYSFVSRTPCEVEAMDIDG